MEKKRLGRENCGQAESAPGKQSVEFIARAFAATSQYEHLDVVYLRCMWIIPWWNRRFHK
jgi:hypothetical protein